MRGSLLPTAFVLLLGACGATPQPDYFLLTADAPVGTEHAGQSVGIASVEVAEYLRRAELVTMADRNRLRIDPYRRWAEPVDDGIRRTLALNLGALLGTDGVRVMPWPRDWVPQWLLRCSIARLDVRENEIELVALWSVQDGKHNSSATARTSRLTRVRSGTGGDSIAADISQLLLELSREIALATATPTEPAVVAPGMPPETVGGQ